jgi:hypothetical protein
MCSLLQIACVENDVPSLILFQLEKDFVNVVGDTLIASCSIAYLGPFTPDYRERLVGSWHRSLGSFGIPHTPSCTLTSVLSDPLQLKTWSLASLPNDAHSVENAVMLTNARRRPLFVDPQGQAVRFVRNLARDPAASVTGLDILRTVRGACVSRGEFALALLTSFLAVFRRIGSSCTTLICVSGTDGGRWWKICRKLGIHR